MQTAFTILSKGWNADPNAPEPLARVDGHSLHLTFDLNSYQDDLFEDGDWAEITFSQCSRYRLGPTNDEGWYRGQCRFSKLAPTWGEFYEVTGDLMLNGKDLHWKNLLGDSSAKHFLFYFRDETFECDAADWGMTFHAAPRIDRYAAGREVKS